MPAVSPAVLATVTFVFVPATVVELSVGTLYALNTCKPLAFVTRPVEL